MESVAAGEVLALGDLVNDVVGISSVGDFKDPFKKDCTDLCRRISLLSHLVDEIRESSSGSGQLRFLNSSSSPSSPSTSCFSDLVFALQSAKRLLLVASGSVPNEEAVIKKLTFQFQCVTWKLEKSLGDIPYDQLSISEEVQEQVELVRAQLRRATERYGPQNSSMLFRALSQPLEKVVDVLQLGSTMAGSLHIDNIGTIDHENEVKVEANVSPSTSVESSGVEVHHILPPAVPLRITNSSASKDCKPSSNPGSPADGEKKYSSGEDDEETNKANSVTIPEDFLCPIALEIMRDPVIVATGQTYERSYIQRWIDSGNSTCPKTQQKLMNYTLTPNYVLRSLISQWCLKNNIEPPTSLATGKIKKSDGSFLDVSGDIAAIQSLVRKLSTRSVEDQRYAAQEIRSLSKRSTDNRILIAEAGAIPVLVKLLTADDTLTQENAVTSILNLSIFEDNKELIMLAGATPSIVQVLRNGSMEARENAAATLFSLSLADENKIIIGASGAIPALVELLQSGSLRGKKDAATALFNLCIYQGNKGRAVRAGVIPALLKMLTESSHSRNAGCMVDEALTILSVLAGHQEAKVAIVKAGTITVLIDLMRTGLPRNKENAAAILLGLCKRDAENLSSLRRLGGATPLTELTKSGTERAKRKATSLLELLRRLEASQKLGS